MKTTKEKSPRGRPKIDQALVRKPRAVAVSDRDWERWKGAAAKRGISVAQLIHLRMAKL